MKAKVGEEKWKKKTIEVKEKWKKRKQVCEKLGWRGVNNILERKVREPQEN